MGTNWNEIKRHNIWSGIHSMWLSTILSWQSIILWSKVVQKSLKESIVTICVWYMLPLKQHFNGDYNHHKHTKCYAEYILHSILISWHPTFGGNGWVVPMGNFYIFDHSVQMEISPPGRSPKPLRGEPPSIAMPLATYIRMIWRQSWYTIL